LLQVGAAVSSIYLLLTLATSIKRGLYGRYYNNETGTIQPSEPHFFSSHNLFGVEILLALWMAACSVLATVSYVFLHRAVSKELTSFNEDLTAAAENSTLLASLESFSIRHLAILKLVAFLTERTNTFASFSTVCFLVVNRNPF
ncbi:hypothetical protein PFISCL1PPCAC_13479, partial [Pristionchus fissidentatus]